MKDWRDMSTAEKIFWWVLVFVGLIIFFFLLFTSLSEGAVAQDTTDDGYAPSPTYEPQDDSGYSSSYDTYEDELETVPTTPSQQVCISPVVLENPLTHNTLRVKRICTTMRGKFHWVQYWPLGIMAANEYGDIRVMVQFIIPTVTLSGDTSIVEVK